MTTLGNSDLQGDFVVPHVCTAIKQH